MRGTLRLLIATYRGGSRSLGGSEAGSHRHCSVTYNRLLTEHSGAPAEAPSNDCIRVFAGVPTSPGNMLIGPYENLGRLVNMMEVGLINP